MATKEKKSAPVQKESGIGAFFKGVKTEFRKVIWPDRETIIKQMIAVVCVTVVAGAVIAVIDFGAQNLINLLTTIGA